MFIGLQGQHQYRTQDAAGDNLSQTNGQHQERNGILYEVSIAKDKRDNQRIGKDRRKRSQKRLSLDQHKSEAKRS